MEPLDQMSVPAAAKAMTAVNLQHVGLISVLLLQTMAGMVVALGIRVAKLDHVDGWSIW